MEILLLLFVWLYVLLQLLVLAGYASDRPKALRLLAAQPVAILIPARNEAENMAKCLQAIGQLNYPKDLLEVWVGNDGSEDQTAAIVEDFSKRFPYIHLYQVQGNLGSARAKGNVLAQLMQQSKAEFVFVTDADIEVAPDWINALLPHLLEKNSGIVSGTTLVDGLSYFEKWQGLEWSLGNGYLIGLNQLGMKSTAVGNNMCFTRSAYLATGGYENMPFSVTEDFQLFSAIRKKGYASLNLIEANSLNISAAQKKLMALLHQRKRWMIGAQDLPWYWLFVFGLQAMFYPCLLTLCFINMELALGIWLVKIALQSLYLLLIHLRLKRRIHWPSFLLFEPYTFLVQLLMMVFYLLPVKMDWKNRQY